MVEFNKVSKVYDKKIFAIEDIDFKIKEGEFVFLIGPSGSGKTTIIKMLIRDEVPSTGSIIFNNKDITRVNRSHVYKIRREIGVIFQDYKLVQDKTAYENVAFAMEAAGKKTKEIKETVPYVLDIVGLSSRLKAFPRQLSGGEQQRVAIARAIANNPKILIADEPTGNLDPASAWDIIQVLTKINNWGTTVIMSTHGTDIVNSLSKRVIQMQGGKIVRDIEKGSYDSFDQYDLSEKSLKKENQKSKTKKSGFKIKLSGENLQEEKNELENTDLLNNNKKDNSTKRFKLFSKFKKTGNENNSLAKELNSKKTLLEMDLASASINSNRKDLFVNLNSKNNDSSQSVLASKIEDVKNDSTLSNNFKANQVSELQGKTSIKKLDLPNSILKDLKSLGYKYIEEIINDGVEEVSENLLIDEDELILISKEIKKFLESK